MPLLSRRVSGWLAALLRPVVDEQVAAALERHHAEAPHTAPQDLLEHAMVYGDRGRLHVHETAVVNNALFNLSSGEITVEEYAFFGHNVSVLTGTHDVTTFDRERQVAVPRAGRDVVVGRGAWVSSNALVLGPCRIGEHAVVAAGSVVMGDVPAYTVVAGSPARCVKSIPRPDGRAADWEPPARTSRFDAVYPAFQARFRGAEQDVRARMQVYLPVVSRADTGLGVCDLGPGRGEWLGMLAERGLRAYGVEASPRMAAGLRSRGIAVEEADAVEHLQGLAPGTLDVVSAVHVVEHLDLETVLAMLAAARAALRPGGLLLLETPDPTNLVMGACNFRLDPTHLQPLPPALTEFLVRASGFDDVQVWPLHPKEDADLGGLRWQGVDERTGTLLTQALAKGLFGPQDYALLARREAEV